MTYVLPAGGGTRASKPARSRGRDKSVFGAAWDSREESNYGI